MGTETVRAEICQRAAMNAIRESVRHEIDRAFQAEERARIREEQGLEGEEEEEEDEGPDPVPAITRAHFEVGAERVRRADDSRKDANRVESRPAATRSRSWLFRFSY